MINLLPPSQKEKVYRERVKKVTITIVFHFIIFLLFLSFSFFGASYYGVNILRREADYIATERDQITDLIEISKEVELVNQRMQLIDEHEKKSVSLSETFKKIERKIPKDIMLSSFELNQDDGYQILISGHIENWQTLVELETALEDNFNQVEFSSDSWIKPEDIDFSVTFKIDEENL